MENLLWSELKQLFTYSPIHLLRSGNKMQNGKLVLVGVKTTIHLFTYFTFLATPLDKQFRNSVLVNSTVHHRQSSGNKMEHGQLSFGWS